MTRPVRAALTCCLVAAAVAGPAAASEPRARDYSVGYSSLGALHSAVAHADGAIVRRVPALRVARVRLRGDAARFAAWPGISFVDRTARRAATSDPALQPLSAETDEPLEWQYAATREDAVPDWVLRAASAVTIAVVDTGADVTAPDIAAKRPITHNARNGKSDVLDTFGHGTFVAALAAGSVTNGEGIAGFGGDAKLMVVKAGNGDGSFTDLDEAAAISYAVDRGARIINLSLGGPSTTAAEAAAVRYATNHGVLVVAAAGNQYLARNPVYYPAALVQPLGSEGAGGTGLAVGASTPSGERAPFSNTGTYLSLLAPGEDVFSAVSSTSSPASYARVPLPGSLGGLYGIGSGTSFAAPEVAGAAALVMAANPLLDAATVAQILKETASREGGWTPEAGWGVLDAAAAVERAAGAEVRAAHAKLRLRTHVVSRAVRLTATLSSPPAGPRTGGRVVAFDVARANGTWRTLGKAPTRPDGTATWKVTTRTARALRLRARWNGATDLARASSGVVAARTRY